MENRTCFMIGMPSSGKTTYLVSLTSMLMLGEIETLLTLKNCDIPEGMENIQDEIRDFNKFQPVGRTLRAAGGWIELPLTDKRGDKVWLRIPDLSGEIFLDLVCERRLKKDIAAHLRGADVLLFFLNLNTITHDKLIPVNGETAIGIIEKGYKDSVLESAKALPRETGMQKERQVTQSDLVELLQCVHYLANKRIKVKLIISAWDSIEKQFKPGFKTPEKCIEQSLPLLSQFLSSNPDRIDSEIWGVSAQGFDFTNPEELEKCLMDDIGNHARVITPEGQETHDLTRLLFLN